MKPRRAGADDHVVGHALSAVCTAESVLQDFGGLPPFNANLAPYTLVCTPSTGSR